MALTEPLRVGYVVKRYPRYSETFVVREILAHEEAGLEIDAQTGFPGWDGERLDYAWALDSVLRE